MIKQKQQHKIAMIGDSLSNGGAERVHALLSKFFDSHTIEVHNCIFTDQITYDYSGSILNLGQLATHESAPIRKLKRFFALRKFISENNFDHIIDFRMRTSILQEFLISKVYKKNANYTVHSSKLDYYVPNSDFWARRIYHNHKLIGVSKYITDKISEREIVVAVQNIYNPVEKYVSSDIRPITEKYVVSAGRMHEIKQFDKLIDAYSRSDLPAKNIKLVLLGEGDLKSEYIALAKQIGLEDKIVFTGFVSNSQHYFEHALFYALSSKNEGLPMVLIESLAAGTPVISFDCVSGPSEIIVNRENGLLVEDQNFDKLTFAMNEFVNDISLYEHCKRNSQISIRKFELATVGKQWLEYLKIDVV